MKKSLAQILGEWLLTCPSREIFIALGILGLTVYAGAILHPFVHDDIFFLVQNPSLRDFHFWKTLVHPLDMGVAGVGVNMYYRPLLDLVNYGQYLLYGFNPHAFHFFNIILHIINSFLVYSILVRILTLCPGMTRDTGRWTAVITAVIFLVHPVQTQAVDCVSGISNLLFAVLGLSAVLLYLEFRREDQTRRAVYFYGASILMLALALLAKEQALVLPLLIAWFEFCFFKNSSRMSLWKVMACVSGLFLVDGIYVIWKKHLMGAQPLLGGHFLNPEFLLRLESIPRILLTNVGLVLFPHDLHYFRSVDILAPKWPSIVFLTVIIISGVMVYRRMSEMLRRLVMFGLGWFLLAQLLTVNIFPLIWEYSYISAAEHFLYVPMVGVVFPCVAGFLVCCPSRIRIEWKAVTVIIVIMVLSLATIRQHDVWRSEVDLFERAAQYEPGLGRVQMLLGRAYDADWRFPSAVRAYSAARDRMMAYERRAFGEPSKQFYRVMRKDIDHGMAMSYQAMKDFASSERYFLEALQLFPDDAVTHNDLGVLYTMMKKNDAALQEFRKAFDLNVEHEMYVKNYALALATVGDKAQAITFLEERLQTNPTDGLQALLEQIRQMP